MNVLKKLVFLLLVFPMSAFGIGAIAVDDEQGETDPGYGVSTGHATRDEARRAALRECKKAGNENCEVVAWFETCGAYASSKKYSGAGWGGTKRAAERMAREKCNAPGCRIIISECE